MFHRDTETILLQRVCLSMDAKQTRYGPLDGVEAYSFRQMYRLASAVASAHDASPTQRRAARRVVVLLKPLIDQAIAPAKLLAEPRRRFLHLVEVIMEDSCGFMGSARTSQPGDKKAAFSPGLLSRSKDADEQVFHAQRASAVERQPSAHVFAGNDRLS